MFKRWKLARKIQIFNTILYYMLIILMTKYMKIQSSYMEGEIKKQNINLLHISCTNIHQLAHALY